MIGVSQIRTGAATSADDITTLALCAGSGDSDAFARLIEQVYDRIYRIAFRWCGNRDEAQDLTQDVCIKLARTLSSYRGEAAFTTWLYRLVLNAARDRGRARGRLAAREAPLDAADCQNASTRPADSATTLDVRRAVARLPEKLRGAVVLVLMEGLTHAEAGRILGCREGTVSWRISIARKRLMADLDRGTAA
ncbi:MAG: RNA polymerase sigma factor [Pseudomonadota bacterium]|nr:RNA polymerase sigma factor [Pseudomonadota bacterium]